MYLVLETLRDSQHMLKLLAEIRLSTEEEGGMHRDGFSGMRPAVRVGDELTTSEIWEVNGLEWLVRGMIYEVQINLFFGETYQDAIFPGMEFQLHFASQVIGHGVVTAILTGES
jgi:translation elongation factor EF-Tu-like GTPase